MNKKLNYVGVIFIIVVRVVVIIKDYLGINYKEFKRLKRFGMGFCFWIFVNFWWFRIWILMSYVLVIRYKFEVKVVKDINIIRYMERND